MKPGESRAKVNRRIRQEALRDQLAKQKHLEHIVDSIQKMAELGDGDSFELQKHKTMVELRMKLVNKYLPDLKAMEHTGEGDDPLTVVIKKIAGN